MQKPLDFGCEQSVSVLDGLGSFPGSCPAAALPLRGFGSDGARCAEPRTEDPMELTHTQIVMLSAASQREDRGIELPPKLKGGAAHKLVGRLISEGLIEEIHAEGSLPVWRRDDDNRSLALRITKRGLKAIQVKDDPADEGGAAAKRHRKTAPRQRIHIRQGGKLGTLLGTQAFRSRAGSKQAQVIEMLRRLEGATVPTIMKATGWQPHSVRGFLAGCVRKKLGLTLASEKIDGERSYRIKDADRSGAATTKSKRQAA